MDNLIIFGAKYLFTTSIILGAVVFYKNRTNWKRNLTLAALQFPLTFLLSRLATSLYYNPRPFVEDKFEPLIYHAADNGFPSDHALLTFTIAAWVTGINPKLALSLWVIAVLVALSRVGAGVHHLIDIAGSLGLAVAGGLLSYAIIQKIWNKNKSTNLPSL